MKKHQIYKTLKDYQNGTIDKYEAMEALDIDHVRDLLALVAEHQLPLSLESAYYQSDPLQKPLEDYLKDE